MRITRTYECRLLFLVVIAATFQILLLSFPVVSQVSEDFSDGDFTINPSWTGDLAEFKISYSNAVPASLHPSLQLDASGSDTSCLVVQQTPYAMAEWSFWIKLSFNTSSENYARIYLTADQEELKHALDGYFLQVGGSTDSLVLYRQTGLDVEPILRGQTGYSGNSTNVFRVKVVYDDQKYWRIYLDPEGGGNLFLDGIQQDLLYEPGNYFGLYCKYTSSNASKVYFDDVFSNGYAPDTIRPEIIDITAGSEVSIFVEFSEAMQPSTMLTANFTVNPGMNHPVQLSNISQDNRIVELLFEEPFQEDVSYTLNTSALADLEGNLLLNPSMDFNFIQAYVVQAYDVLINEVMVDINPEPAGLPAAQYIELYNASGELINLASLLLMTKENTDPEYLPDQKIHPNEYLLLCSPDDVEQLNQYGTSIGLPDFHLSREGKLDLLSEQGEVIHFLEYDEDTYGHNLKQNGGWALEQKDPFNPCLVYGNWGVSESPEGGTPGSINSVDANNDAPLVIQRALCISDSMLMIELNYSLQFPGGILAENAFVDHTMGHPITIFPMDSYHSQFLLQFNSPFLPGRKYYLRLAGIVDRLGNSLADPNLFFFGVPQPPEFNDLVINEVLFDPAGSGVDYVELYNRSQKVLNLQDLLIGSVKVDQFGMPDITSKVISEQDYLVLMEDYIVLTTEPVTVHEQYEFCEPSNLFKVDALASYPNDGGTVLLTNLVGEVIDEVSYNPSMHHPLVKNPEGVSLERIHFDRFSGDDSNWHSASSTCGYGTPGLRNSQFQEQQAGSGNVISIQPYIFSPDNDGTNDVVSIFFRFPEPGYMATASVYDHAGRPVRLLLNNELMGMDPVVTWDGRNDRNETSGIGLYILLMEAFHPGGQIIREKEVIVLGARLD